MFKATVKSGALNTVVKEEYLASGITVAAAFDTLGLSKASPSVATLNERIILRKDWEEVCLVGDSVVFTVLAANKTDQFVGAIMAPTLVLPYMAINRASKALLPKASSPALDFPANVVEEDKAKAVYSFAGKSNSFGRNSPIETAYGKNKWYPSYVCLPYVEYINNVAYMRVWLSLGHGDFEIESVRAGELDVNDIPGCFWQYIQSNLLYTSRSIFFDAYTADVVITAPDVSNVELKGPDEDDYQELLIEALTNDNDTVDTVLVNFAFPSGCYTTDVTGGIYGKQVDVLITLTKESGVGKGTEVAYPYSLSFASKTPQRATVRLAVSGKGRWSIKVKRLTNGKTAEENTGSDSQDSLQVESIVALKESETTYKTSGIYLLLEASSSLNSEVLSKINVTATRKLPVYDGVGWTTVATRSPIWAAFDLLSASYAGGKNPDTLDVDYFFEMSRQIQTNFDFVFNQKTTVDEALRTIANSFRGNIFPVGSDYHITVPSRNALPTVMFGPDNTSDVSWSLYTKKELDNDCVDVGYVDPSTGTEELVRFTPVGSAGLNPRAIKAQGCSDRTRAWQQGAYSQLSDSLGRDTLTLRTTDLGQVPALGDLAAISWPFPGWGTGGAVVTYAAGVLTVTEDLPVPTGNAWLLLQTPEGKAWGPYPCTRTGTRQITVPVSLPSGIDFDAIGKNPVLFTFGERSEISRWFTVTDIDYGDKEHSISGTFFKPEVFAYDESEAPENDLEPVTLEATYLEGIQVEFYDASYMRVSWKAVADAEDYLVRYSWNPSVVSDPTDLLRRYALTNYPLYLAGGGAYQTAKVFNTEALLARSTGDLYIEITPIIDGVPDTAHLGVWRAQFTATTARSSVLVLGSYGANAQASLTYAVTGDTRSQELLYLDFYSDAASGFEPTLQLTPKNSLGVVISDLPVIERVFGLNGKITITSEELAALGWGDYFGDFVSFISCKLVNQDATEITFDTEVSQLNWASDYNTDSLSISTSAHGSYNMQGYPVYVGREHKDIVPDAFYDYTVRLKQPNKFADRQQSWGVPTGPIQVGIIPEALVGRNKRFHYFAHGHLGATLAFPTAAPGGQLLVTLALPPSWSGFTEGGSTPETLIKTNGALVIGFRKPEASYARLERQVPLALGCFLFIQYKADTDEWYLKKNNNLGGIFNPASITPFTTEEIDALVDGHIILPEWPIPKGYSMGNITCSRRGMLTGIGPSLTIPLVLGTAP